jgi:nickel transport protein
MKALSSSAIILALLLLAAPASAHKLKVFATVEGANIAGSVYFAGGGKAADVPGRILGTDGSLVATFTTGADGSFRQGVKTRMDYIITVESEDGHAAQFTIPAAEFPPALPEGRTTVAVPADIAVLEEAIARQIKPLREQLDASESRTRLHDLMGGIGTIFGLFGCWAWLQSRRRGS